MSFKISSYFSLSPIYKTSSGTSDDKESACHEGAWVWSLGQEDSLEMGMWTHSNILAWKIPWTEEPGWLQFIESQRVRHNWAANTLTFLKNKVFLDCVPAQLCPTFCNPLGCIACQGFSVHGIFKARILGWVDISSSRGSSLPGDHPYPGIKPTSLVSPALAGRFLTNCTTWKALRLF